MLKPDTKARLEQHIHPCINGGNTGGKVNTSGTTYCGLWTNGCNTDVFMSQKISLV